MTSYNFADVVIVPFPFTDGIGTKKRPAVVISVDQYQQSRPDIILLAITSRLRDPLGYGEVVVENWQQAGLLKPSVLKPLIFTLEQSKVLMRLGSLLQSDKSQLEKLLGRIIGNPANK
ncbi:MAG: type II toxin-antitoxin system PemK/MazF family toxin [Candidatus Competibacteraceae bacterium]|uniref:Growth inhibitor n=1 Tax=Candidatus Contendobacter odensis Run_B_J11 TaxID=1400861 RepID=A0A7U7G8K5_9GAMM|nr:type II toxin-antitoxin system PemK/MazF family toxin [Candidatus Contendobacter odensis]MBK8536103.1 type II toxin-antitoxin system PemK/MazF family toxin [Candidatus Competibacteraceae bacterium]MBK8754845.1 type II toxin-antitoxin system PemK/MazF family toxin [Candidatus Competibacteraceae bacterium]CDH43905.1 conserved hypothetical protein [Candidatus Contendobacter odensis Run_B_J11]